MDEKDSRVMLEKEAYRLYYEFINKKKPSKRIISRYIDANIKILPRTYLKKIKNLNHLEFCERTRNPNNILTKKVKIIHYLAESESTNNKKFFNSKSQRFSLAWTVFSLILYFIYYKIKPARYIDGV